MLRAPGLAPVWLAAVLLAATAAAPQRALATIQEESCIEPDIEYPVPCEE